MQISNTIRRTLGAALLLALVGTTQSFAQSTYAEKDQSWWNGLQAQLAESAESDIAQVRHEAYRHIIFFSENYDEFVNFDDVAYEVMAQFEVSDSVEERLLALATLDAIGEDGSLDRLMEVAEAEQSERVRSVAAAVLRNHVSS